MSRRPIRGRPGIVDDRLADSLHALSRRIREARRARLAGAGTTAPGTSVRTWRTPLGALLDEVFPGWDANKNSTGRDARPDRPPVAAEQMAGTEPGSRPAPADRGTQ